MAARSGPVRSEVIGREQGLAELEAFLAAADGLPAAFLVEGEPGIGKTSLWRAGLELAPAHGYRVLQATPATAEARLSFAALADLLEPVLDEALPELPAPQRRALEVALLLEDSEGQPPDHRAVSVAFLGVLRALALDAPVLVAVDDVQWLDGPSAFALEFALRRLREERVRFLLAQRTEGDGDRLPLGLDRAFPEERRRQLPLGPLSLGALHYLLRERVGLTLPRPKLRRLHELSGGNPFFALELARAVERGSIGLEAGEPLPASLDALVHERVEGLPAGTREALLTASALSQPTLELVSGALGRDAAPALAPGLEARVVELEGARIRFAHPLLASGVYGEAGADERRALHGRLAELVPDTEERARHLALAANEPDENVAVIIDGAAEEAHGRGATAAAAELCEQAFHLTPPELADDGQRRRIAAARYRYLAGDLAGARSLLEDTVASVPAGSLRADALALLARVYRFEGDQPLSAELARQALREAGTDERVRAEAAQELSSTLFFLREDLEVALQHAALAAELAGRAGLTELERHSLDHKSMLEVLVGRPGAAAALAAPDETDRSLAERVISSRRYFRAYVLLWTDGVEEAGALLRTCLEDTITQGDESSVPLVLVPLAWVDYLAGRWHESAGLSEEAHDVALQVGQRAQEALSLSARALVRASLGLEAEARADAAEALALAGERGMAVARIHALWALGLLELSLDRPEEAAQLLAPHRERLIAAGVGEPGSIRFVPDEVEALVALGRTDEAETLLAWLEERGQTLDGPSTLAAAARCRGLFALARRDTAGALASFEEALRQHERVDMPFERARTLLAQGVALRHARRRRDARAVLQEAKTAFATLGAALWEQKAAAELGRIGGRRATGDELTPAEERVAALVAEGRTNKEVAAALFLTERTVEFHLTHVYRKLGVRSRSELAHRLG
jgi:DNA-binding CsgD family transcriptional regulator